MTFVEASNMRCEDAVTIRRDDWGRRDNINNITFRGQYKYKIGNQEIKGSTVKEQHGSRSVAARSEDLYETTWNIPHADLIGVPTDIVLEANKVEETLVEVNIHTKWRVRCNLLGEEEQNHIQWLSRPTFTPGSWTLGITSLTTSESSSPSLANTQDC